MDGRTKAILDALEDIQTARQKLEAREKREALAKEEITILKVDAELQRRQLEDARSVSRRAQERLRQIEFDIDDASRALRRARTRVQLARDQLEELKTRHWAVLGYYNPDQAEEMVAEALNEFRLSQSIARPVEEMNGSADTALQASTSEQGTLPSPSNVDSASSS
jgi:chromosome segregation ATPase